MAELPPRISSALNEFLESLHLPPGETVHISLHTGAEDTPGIPVESTPKRPITWTTGSRHRGFCNPDRLSTEDP